MKKNIEIKNTSRPTSNLYIIKVSKSKTRDYVRKFIITIIYIYITHDWISACSETNRLYCFPCLFYGWISNNVTLIKNGINDLINLTSKTKMHEKLMKHVDFN